MKSCNVIETGVVLYGNSVIAFVLQPTTLISCGDVIVGLPTMLIFKV